MPILQELRKHPSKKILLLGSGGLSIGQAGEFDYSGTQAARAIQECGFEAIVVNPNIATVQTNPEETHKVYLYPIEPEWIEKIIETEKPAGIMTGFGGQTAINCVLKLEDLGILTKHNVIHLGTCFQGLRDAEDRSLFKEKMHEIGVPVPPSVACCDLEMAVKAANKIGYPVIVRAAFALGGLRSGIAHKEYELIDLVNGALSLSPQVLVEKSLYGWKELEYEVMHDRQGNIITICNMENFDPLGIHTGDSIVVAPSQTLSDAEYQLLRNTSFKVAKALNIVGECNVQYALDPHSEAFYVIEANPRLSRSSALASKATGYPIASLAAKVVLGYSLTELKNPVTGITCALYEPALDYLVVKIPRWDMNKFLGVSRELGTTMKSVGEIMAIGRNFCETLQKAVRMITEDQLGVSRSFLSEIDSELLFKNVSSPTDLRLFYIFEAVRRGYSVDEIHQASHVDKWFLEYLKLIVLSENEIKSAGQLEKVTKLQWQKWKEMGFSDTQIACLAQVTQQNQMDKTDAALYARKLRLEAGVTPHIKKIDTTAAEYPSPSNYFYFTYHAHHDDTYVDDGNNPGALVLGCGSYRVGTSVEFDWCAVACSYQLKRNNWRSILLNCNPETVSTDHNVSTRLYFDEISIERVLDIAEKEKIDGVILSMSGQIGNTLAIPLQKAGINILGHSAQTIDKVEDRAQFSELLDSLDIRQPRWIRASSSHEIKQFMNEVDFPVLVRPSYVLSGAAICVAVDEASLQRSIESAHELSSEFPIVVSEFLENAKEIEYDGVAQNGQIVVGLISEHVENAGVHSGDATVVFPSQRLYASTIRAVNAIARKIALEINLNGPFNLQLLAKSNEVKVIECNARASRSFPFITKTSGINLAKIATDVMIGIQCAPRDLDENSLPYVGVKAAMFSFTRLPGFDPILGVEMYSTGEVGCIGENFNHALHLALEASGLVKRPRRGILVSSGPQREKIRFLRCMTQIAKLNIPIYATPGTARSLREHGFDIVECPWPREGEKDVISLIERNKVDLVINIPKNSEPKELAHDRQIRQTAVQNGVSLLTNMEKTVAYFEAVIHELKYPIKPRSLPRTYNPQVI